MPKRSRTNLFLTPASKSETEETLRGSIRRDGGPGCIPEEPLALVVDLSVPGEKIVEMDHNEFMVRNSVL